MALDRHGVLSVEPRAARLEEAGEDPHRVDRVVDAVGGKRLAGADLDADVRAVQLSERVLVGDVVAEVEHRARARLRAERVQGRALVGREERQLGDVLPVRDVDVGPRAGPVLDGGERLPSDLRVGAAHVHGDAGGLRLQADARVGACDRAQLGEEPVVEVAQLRLESLDEAEVELRAVAADEMDLAREPRERREVAEGATRR